MLNPETLRRSAGCDAAACAERSREAEDARSGEDSGSDPAIDTRHLQRNRAIGGCVAEEDSSLQARGSAM
jgi:hypothetical protein